MEWWVMCWGCGWGCAGWRKTCVGIKECGDVDKDVDGWVKMHLVWGGVSDVD